MFDILYYEAPTDEIFNEVKEACIKVWKTYDNEFGYVDEKVGRIQNISNVKDNLMFMVAMFDHHNKQRLSQIISEEARLAIVDRIKSGYNKQSLGMDMELNPFM